jgi:hypothetical protein
LHRLEKHLLKVQLWKHRDRWESNTSIKTKLGETVSVKIWTGFKWTERVEWRFFFNIVTITDPRPAK